MAMLHTRYTLRAYAYAQTPRSVACVCASLCVCVCVSCVCVSRWLLETGQEEKAGLVKEGERDYLGAITLYLKGGLPARAAQVCVLACVCVCL